MAGAAQAGLASGDSSPCPLLSLDSVSHCKGSDEQQHCAGGAVRHLNFRVKASPTPFLLKHRLPYYLGPLGLSSVTLVKLAVI